MRENLNVHLGEERYKTIFIIAWVQLFNNNKVNMHNAVIMMCYHQLFASFLFFDSRYFIGNLDIADKLQYGILALTWIRFAVLQDLMEKLIRLSGHDTISKKLPANTAP